MKTSWIKISNVLCALALIGVVVAGSVANASAATPSSSIREAQTIMTKFGLPTGTIDGIFGPNTARGLCAFRQISGLSTSRSTVDVALMNQLRSYNSTYVKLSAIPAPTKGGHSTYVVVSQTCQTLTYVESGHYVRIMAASTGMSGHSTNDGAYSLGNTQRGWHCSTLYPESCNNHTVGRFSSIASYGNMYNRRSVYGGVYVHGSTDVPTYPASHGCIRVNVTDSDWMYDHVGNNGAVYMQIVGSY